jgi:signal transduction histidine kinase
MAIIDKDKLNKNIDNFGSWTVRYKPYIVAALLAIMFIVVFVDFASEYLKIGIVLISTLYVIFCVVVGKKEVTKNLNELTQSNRILETLMYSMAHDLKSPVRSAAGMLSAIKEDIRDGELDCESLSYMLDIADNSLRLSMDTVDEVLDYAKFGQNLRIKSKINVDRYVVDLVMSLKQRDFIHFESLGEMNADPKAMKRVFQNLIENGLKYNCKVEKIVKLYRKGNVIVVEDNGNGIEERYFSKIIKPFQRLDNNTEGTGLGLGIVSRVLELHGFKLKIKSELGVGSKFEIWLQ